MALDADTEVSMRQRFTRCIRQHTGLDERIAHELAQEAFRAILFEYRQERIYVSESKRERNRKIRAEFNGRNGPELMKRYNISKATLYRVVGRRAQ